MEKEIVVCHAGMMDKEKEVAEEIKKVAVLFCLL